MSTNPFKLPTTAFEAENEHFEQESSRLVKICILKYKCFLVFLFSIFAISQIALLAIINSDVSVISSLKEILTDKNISHV